MIVVYSVTDRDKGREERGSDEGSHAFPPPTSRLDLPSLLDWQILHQVKTASPELRGVSHL